MEWIFEMMPQATAEQLAVELSDVADVHLGERAMILEFNPEKADALLRKFRDVQDERMELALGILGWQMTTVAVESVRSEVRQELVPAEPESGIGKPARAEARVLVPDQAKALRDVVRVLNERYNRNFNTGDKKLRGMSDFVHEALWMPVKRLSDLLVQAEHDPSVLQLSVENINLILRELGRYRIMINEEAEECVKKVLKSLPRRG